MKKILNILHGIGVLFFIFGVTSMKNDVAEGLTWITLGLIFWIDYVIKGIIYLVALLIGNAKNKKNDSGNAEEDSAHKTDSNNNETVDVIHTVDEQKENTPRIQIKTVSSVDRYEYERVGVYRPDGVGPMPEIGTNIYFEQDPTNPYDDHAVKAIYYDGEKIVAGYLNRGKIKNMVWDWLSNEWEYNASVTRADNRLEVSIEMERR